MSKKRMIIHGTGLDRKNMIPVDAIYIWMGKKNFKRKKRITNHLYLVLLVPFQ